MGRKWSSSAPYGRVGMSSIGFGLVMAVVSVGVGAGFNVGLTSFMSKTDVPNAAIVSTDPAGGRAKPSSAGSIEPTGSTKSDAAESHVPSEPEESAISSASSRVLQITPSSPVDRILNIGVMEPKETSLRQALSSQVQNSQVQNFLGEGTAANSIPGQTPKGDSPTTLVMAEPVAPNEPGQPSILVQPKANSDASVGGAQASANPGDG